MSPRKPRKPSGRVAFDQKGNATWEWQRETGRYADDIDTQELKTIGADLRCEGDHVPNSSPLHDPYDRPALPDSRQPHPHKRTLDDLRRLSEEIKAAREKKDRESR